MWTRVLEKNQQRLQSETGARSNPWGGRLSVALVYPNNYHTAMSNLGYLTVYQLLNSREDCLCERFVLPDREDLPGCSAQGKGKLGSLESGRPLSDFDLIAFSISFEGDYLNLPLIFELGHLPLYARERSSHDPLVLCGGVCSFLNPEPLAEIMDAFAVGEAEMLLPPLMDLLQSSDETREHLLAQVRTLPGFYVPGQHQPGDAPVRRQWVPDLEGTASRSFIYSEQSEFSDMALTEISRGCGRGCRFCAAGFIYLPARERSLATLLPQVEEGLCHRTKLGLVGAAVSDYSDIDALSGAILERGGTLSVASLRLDSLGVEEIRALKASGHKTISLAPEAGSQRMRDLINKNLTEAQILSAAQLLAQEQIRNLKLYFLFGLPGEEQSDLDELVALCRKILHLWREAGRSQGQIGTLTVSLNPFIPKPFTPLQWAGMDELKALEKKSRFLRKCLDREPNFKLNIEPLRSAQIQALFSRGDRRVGQLLPLMHAGKNLKAACRELELELDELVHRTRDKDEAFPWEVIDNGVRRDYLWQEYRNALEGKLTPRCAPGCKRCGVCG